MSSSSLTIRRVTTTEPEVEALLGVHLVGMHATSPSEHVHALDSSGLSAPDVTLLGAWAGADLAGIGALREIDATHGEVKSMRTAEAYLRRGVAQALLDELITLARGRGYGRVSLETGTHAEFAPAVALYERNGFVPCAPFAEYAASEHSLFLSRALG